MLSPNLLNSLSLRLVHPLHDDFGIAELLEGKIRYVELVCESEEEQMSVEFFLAHRVA